MAKTIAPSEVYDATEYAPEVEIDLIGYGSRLWINGEEFPCVQDIKVHQSMDGPPTVTVTFVAKSVKGMKHERSEGST